MRFFLMMSVAASVAAAQDLPHSPALDAALRSIQANNAWTLAQQRSICEIPAPPFKEHRRALEMKRRFELLGYRNVRIDSVGNVIVERRGVGSGPTVVIAGH